MKRLVTGLVIGLVLGAAATAVASSTRTAYLNRGDSAVTLGCATRWCRRLCASYERSRAQEQCGTRSIPISCLACSQQGTAHERSVVTWPTAKRPPGQAPSVTRLEYVEKAFDPTKVSAFRFIDYDFDESDLRARLRYALDEHEFEEQISFGSNALAPSDPLPNIDRFVWALHLVAGASYYKAAAPGRVEIETRLPSDAGARFLEALYTEGLGEFRFVNGLPLDARLPFPSNRLPTPERIGASDRVLVPVGGGKDSIVTVESLRARHDVALFAAGRAAPIEATIEVAGLPVIRATRMIDPRLLALNDEGAYNGHVPVTAIVSLAALLGARLFGYGSVAMSNERSASEPTISVDGKPINHQFSKSAQAEEMLRTFLEADVAPGLDYFSFLRPFSEIAIARRFRVLTGYHHGFTSCNRVFRIDAARRGTRWCCDCPKCRFVFLALAPFMRRGELASIFGRDMLDDPAQLSGFEELLALDREKPFECVGTVDEARALLSALSASEEWSDAAVVRALGPRLARHRLRLEQFLGIATQHNVPARFADDLESVVHDAAPAQ